MFDRNSLSKPCIIGSTAHLYNDKIMYLPKCSLLLFTNRCDKSSVCITIVLLISLLSLLL